jgi:monomeric isocitrate dehydrogenase
MLSIPLMNGGGLFETGRWISSKHVEQFYRRRILALGLLRIPSTWSFCEAFRTNITQYKAIVLAETCLMATEKFQQMTNHQT